MNATAPATPKKVRTFVRGVTSETYGLDEHRRRQLAQDRVRDSQVITDDGNVAHSGNSATSHTRWRVAPGDEEFLTQTIQMHFTNVEAHGANTGHGHQNEAAFYILEGAGYEFHDGKRYDWQAGDLVYVHTDSVHQHFNPYDEDALALVVKAKSTWMFLGLIQQGNPRALPEPERFGPREEWGRIWTPGVLDRHKRVRTGEVVWEDGPIGRMRVLASKDIPDGRIFSIDAFQLEIEPGGHSSRYWKMADEVYYVLEGGGYALQWEVAAEIDDQYYAHLALEPKRFDLDTDDTLYVPQNHVCQLFAADRAPMRLLNAQNRLFKHLGYDAVHVLEPASSAAPA